MSLSPKEKAANAAFEQFIDHWSDEYDLTPEEEMNILMMQAISTSTALAILEGLLHNSDEELLN